MSSRSVAVRGTAMRAAKVLLTWSAFAWLLSFLYGFFILVWSNPDLSSIAWLALRSGRVALLGFFLFPLVFAKFVYAPLPKLFHGYEHVNSILAHCAEPSIRAYALSDLTAFLASPAACIAAYVTLCMARSWRPRWVLAVPVSVFGPVSLIAYVRLVDWWFETYTCAAFNG